MGTIRRKSYPQELKKKGLLLKSESPVTVRLRINPHELGWGGGGVIWTTKKPTKTGWYWYRGVSDGNTAKVLHFIDDDGDGPYIATSDDLILKDLEGEWAGPVEPPLSGLSR